MSSLEDVFNPALQKDWDKHLDKTLEACLKMTESFDMETEYKLIADVDFAVDWVKEEVNKSVEWFNKEIHSGCVCDCGKAYGKGCLNPKAYLSGGCK